MSGVIKSHVQLGDSTTATNNFMLTAQAADGTVKLARGNNGATSQDVMTVDASGRVAFPQSVVAFSAKVSANYTPTNAAWQKLATNTEDFDTANCFDSTTNYRFQPTVVGYYQLNATAFCYSTSTTLINGGVGLNKGAFVSAPNLGGVTFTTTVISQVSPTASALVYLNGSTDYVEPWAFVSASGGSQLILLASQFSGILVAKA